MKKVLMTAAKLSPVALILGYAAPAFAQTRAWEDWLPMGSFATGDLPGLIQRIIQILLIIGGVIAVIYLIVAGYQYITAGGNAEQAVAARTAILNAVIGIIVVFAAYLIITFVFNRFL